MPLNLSYTVAFSTNEAKTQGSIRITDTTNWAGQGVNPANVEIGIGYTGPDGNAYRTDLVPQVGNIFPNVQLWAEYPLPTDIDGLVQTGDYIVSYHAVSAVGPIDQTETSTENLCTDLPELCLDTNPDCLRLVVTATDSTGWVSDGWTVNSRAMTLQYPSVTYHATITSTVATVSTAGEPIWNGTWTATSTVNATKDNYTIEVTTVKQFDVSCNMDGCRLLCMFKAMYSDFEVAKSTGNTNQINAINGKLLRLGMLSNFIAASINCGDDTLLNSLMNDFKITAIGSATADCQCCDDCSEPQPLVPIWNTGGGSAPTLIAGNNITLTLGSGTVTIAVSAAFSALVASLYNTVVTSTGGSITVSSSTTGITTTYNLAVAQPVRDNLSFRVRFTTGSQTVSAIEFQGTTFQDGPIVVTPTAGQLYSITGFVTSGTPDWFATATRERISLIIPYSNTNRFDGMVAPQIMSTTHSGTGIILFGLQLTSDGLAHSPDTCYDFSVLNNYMGFVDVDFVITHTA